MSNFVISLKDNNEKRRTHISNQFQSMGIPFKFFDAITRSQLHLANDLGVTFDNPLLAPGERACFLSHLTLWKKILDEKIPVAGIFEDDIYFSKEADGVLSSYGWVPSMVHIIKIEKWRKKIKTSITPLCSINGVDIVQLKSRNLCTGGYILTNKGAQYLFEKITSSPIQNAIDEDMFEFSLSDSNYFVYQSIPSLCIQDNVLYGKVHNFPSDLDEGREPRILKKVMKDNQAKLEQEQMQDKTLVEHETRFRFLRFNERG